MSDIKKTNLKSLLFHTLVPLMIAFIISMLIGDFKEFYSSLNKPVDVPPVAFPIIWSILYILMGFAAHLIDSDDTTDKKVMKLYYLQLLVNFLWTPIFFGVKSLLLAAIVALILLVLVIITAIKFYKTNKVSGLLLIPYVLWCIFAAYLAVSIYIMN